MALSHCTEVQVAMKHIAMERLFVKLVVLACSMVSVNYGRSVFRSIFVPGVIEIREIILKSIFHVVRVSELMLFSVKWHSFVHIMMLNSMGCLCFNFMEKLVIFVLDILHEACVLMLMNISVEITVVSILESIKSDVLVVGTLDLATMVERFTVLLVKMRSRSIVSMFKNILLLGSAWLE